MKQRFKTGIGAFVLCVVLLLAGALPVCAVGAHPVPDSGMTLDTSELLLELTNEDPAPVAYLTVHAMLHLLGYDHVNLEDRALMRQREEVILTDLGLTREA